MKGLGEDELMSWYLRVLEKYFVIEGRARRKEYWMFLFLSLIFYTALLLLLPGLAIYYYWAVLIPGFTVSIRRMHDSDHSGWLSLVPFYNFYLLCIDGTRGDNRFGPDPKAGVQPATRDRQQAPVTRVLRADPPVPADSAESSAPGALDMRLVETVTRTQATQGGSVRVTTGSGDEVDVLIPQGTTSGTHLRVPGGGHRHGNQVGDVWVRIKVED
jgi:uncharacterized membrane protein YhaH (DUF805 family)